MKRIEIRYYSDDRLIATYEWGTFLFRYDPDFYTEFGDDLFLTKGRAERQFEKLPDFFLEYLPVIDSSNYRRICEKYSIDKADIFGFITHPCFKNLPAYYYFCGIDE